MGMEYGDIDLYPECGLWGATWGEGRKQDTWHKRNERDKLLKEIMKNSGDLERDPKPGVPDSEGYSRAKDGSA